MDPRQPQHPFSSRNTTSPYGRTPFPPSSNQPQYPSSSHPPPASPAYSDHQRRPSDPPYYNPPRSYGQEGPPMSGPSHSRHQSSSSIGHGTPVNRNMPPPSSPQQQAPQATHHYGPPQSRPPPASVGPPSTYSSGRELPSLPSLGRPPSGNMSISSILGGPSPGSREPPVSQAHYASPVATSAPPSSMFGTTHASPRMTTAGPEYAPFRRPQTPEHQRQYETRDHRANSAGSPAGLGHYGTPEARRFGTPQQSYAQRVAAPEERREPIRVPNPNVPNASIPPRPNSQPSGFNPPPPPRISDPRPPMHNESLFGRRVDTASRPDPPRETAYGRPAYEERHNPYGYDRDRQERERERDREILMQRGRELRERERERERLERERDRERERLEHEQRDQRDREYALQMAQRNPQPGYNRPPEAREQPWMRQNYEPAPPPRPAYEQPAPERVPPQASNGYYPATTAPQYGGHSAYASNEARYGPAPQPGSVPIKHETTPATQYEAAMQERPRYAQQQEQRPMYGGPPQSGPYQSHGSPRKGEEPPQTQQQRYLGVQGINRTGNRSPLPQAVQGAQSQFNAPGGDPAIANEFGKIFGGLGGSGAMGAPSPLSAGPQGLPFSNSGQLRREDLENLQESPLENGQRISRTASNNGRRRKLKEEGGDDESSTGRQTPSGRAKRPKTNSHHHHLPHNHHHHHHRAEPVDTTSSPSQSNLTPFKSTRGSNIPSPPGRDLGATHHHHIVKHQPHTAAAKTPPPTKVNNIIPLQKVTIRNHAVLDSVAELPRKHLGHAYYHSALKPDPLAPKRDFSTSRGFASTPQPLPRFEGNENCTFTVKVMRAYLDHKSREEITIRRAVWGTDIYTDDSDIIAACIHQGWFKGAWPAGVDEDLLGLEVTDEGTIHVFRSPDEIWTKPPASGPADVPKNRDLNVNIMILPLLDKYSSVTRFGIRSREWGGKYDGYHSMHDGLSFMIQSIQWVNGVNGVEGRSAHDRRELLAQEQREADLEAAKTLEKLVLNGNGSGKPQFEESFERGGVRPEERRGEIRGVGMGSWWKKPNGVRKKGPSGSEAISATEEPNGAPPSALPAPSGAVETVEAAQEPELQEPEQTQERDVQQEQSRRISRVTELMIANANSSEAIGRPVTPTRAEIQAPTPSPISPVHPQSEPPAQSGELTREEENRERERGSDEDTDMDATM